MKLEERAFGTLCCLTDWLIAVAVFLSDRYITGLKDNDLHVLID